MVHYLTIILFDYHIYIYIYIYTYINTYIYILYIYIYIKSFGNPWGNSIYTMFITNNHDLFPFWLRENLVKYQKVSKYYVQDCRSTRDCIYIYKIYILFLYIYVCVYTVTCTYTILDIIFWDFLIFYQIFFLPQVKRSVIISNKHGICRVTLRVAEWIKT